MKAGFKILIVEDDVALVSTFKAGLEEDGFEVIVAHTIQDGYLRAVEDEPQAIVLDVMLPDGSGVDLTRRLRAVGVTAPILVLTARGDTGTTVAALDRGADGYVIKPVSIAALGARLRALYRRCSESSEVLHYEDMDFEPERLVVSRGGVEIDLTPVQARLLEALMRHDGRVLTRSQLTFKVWPEGNSPSSNALDVHVKALRSKIDEPFPTPLIETVRGMGYRLRPTHHR